MRNFLSRVRGRARGTMRSYRSTRRAGGGFFRGVLNAARYAATGAGRGG